MGAGDGGKGGYKNLFLVPTATPNGAYAPSQAKKGALLELFGAFGPTAAATQAQGGCWFRWSRVGLGTSASMAAAEQVIDPGNRIKGMTPPLKPPVRFKTSSAAWSVLPLRWAVASKGAAGAGNGREDANTYPE